MPDSKSIELTIPADLKYLNIVGLVIGGLLEHAEIPPTKRDEMTYNIQLATHEVCTNIIEHAYDNDALQRIHLRLFLKDAGKQIIIQLTDTSGRKFVPESVATPDAEKLQVRGFGMFLVHELVDKVDYQHQPDFNRWTLSKTLN